MKITCGDGYNLQSRLFGRTFAAQICDKSYIMNLTVHDIRR